MIRARRRALALVGAGALGISTLIALGTPNATANSFGYQNLNNVQKQHVSGLLAVSLARPAPRRAARRR